MAATQETASTLLRLLTCLLLAAILVTQWITLHRISAVLGNGVKVSEPVQVWTKKPIELSR